MKSSISIPEKREKLRKEGRCYVCFRKFLVSSKCKFKSTPCKICHGNYHGTSICLNKLTNESTLPKESNSDPTKRLVLKAMLKIFDPIGFTAPFSIRMKMLLQETWQKGLQWDENLPRDLKDAWENSCSELEHLSKFQVPRKYFPQGELTAPEIENAELYWIKQTQQSIFNREIELLNREKSIEKDSKLYSLNPKLDENGRSCLNYEEIQTTLMEIEAVINSRPLTFCEENKEPLPLTPSHFLIGQRLNSLSDIQSIKDPESNKKILTKMFKYKEQVINHFWRRWWKEYLLEL
ncbi:uncharacterized protein TNCT_99181 [Trichonephila clavata]|uniref:DUF5641 domain-containing protein n=1 Tax=Trichonephila clavata TaxID=2740835 RepID=A0A8X6FUF4_TRICU|nr:uncharacterized protein TNCT_99181 [Trichonephila clavata]